MEALGLSLSEIQFSVTPTTCKLCCGINVRATQTKVTGVRSGSPYLRSSFKGPFSAKCHGSLPYKRTQPRVHLVRAARVQDKGQEGTQTQNGVLKNSNGNIFDLFCYIFKLGLDILSQKKQEYQKIEEKVEHAADVIEEVAEDVDQVAKLTEEIAEKIESQTAKDGKIYKTAELVDKMSEVIAKDVEILENQAEKIEETLKAIDKSVDKAEDAVEDIAKSVSTVGEDNGSSIKAQKSSTETVEVKSN